ncbi:MAG: hypothetical protein ABW218_00505, partial [Casimicrobiaceae bacterium]
MQSIRNERLKRRPSARIIAPTGAVIRGVPPRRPALASSIAWNAFYACPGSTTMLCNGYDDVVELKSGELAELRDVR